MGIYYAWKDRKKQNTTEFLMGGKAMKVMPTAVSLAASMLSPVQVIGD